MLLKLLTHNKLFVALLSVATLCFLINATYVSYPDEFINILGGRKILEGGLPYRDFFDHHMPLAWYLAALIQLLSRESYIMFRIIWALLQISMILGIGLWVHRRHGSLNVVYAVWSVLYSVVAMYYWLHLYLGDSLAALFFAGAFWIVLLESRVTHVSPKALAVASILIWALIFSSLTYLYVGCFLYLWILYLVMRGGMAQHENTSSVRHHLIKKSLSRVIAWGLVCVAPYGLYLGYLFISGTWKDFYFSNFTYNTTLYISIPNYTAAATRFNPLRLAFTLADNFWGAYLTLLTQLAHPSFYFPIERFIALGTFALACWFIYKRRIIGVLYLGLLTFSAPRSHQLADLKQTDYQSGLFIIMGTIAGCYVIYELVHDLDTKAYFVKFVRSVILLFLVIYLGSSLLFGLFNTLHVKYARYMGTLPPISNISDIADFVETVTSPGDVVWIGPYEGNHSFFVSGRRLAGKYPSLLPQFRESDYLRTDFIDQMASVRPRMIIYRHDASIFMTPAIEFGRFFLDWMQADYVNCLEAGRECRATVRDLKINEDVYIRKDSLELFEKM